MTNKVLLVGHIRLGEDPIDGETVKNQLILKEIGRYCEVIPLDFFYQKHRFVLYVRSLLAFILNPTASIVFSTTAKNFISLIKIFRLLRIKRNIVHWIIGGEFDQNVKDGKFDVSLLNYISYNLAQSHQMVDNLRSLGVHNAEYVSNFKNITFKASIDDIINKRHNSPKKKFVFMSKILRTKGIGIVLDAVELLNKDGHEDRYCVDFYGPSHPDYMDEFLLRVSMIRNVEYRGVLKFDTREGYKLLSDYNAFLFPTFHPSEGVAGVVLDAYISGLPVIASDWGHNSEYIYNNRTGIIIPPHDAVALKSVMEKIILDQIDLDGLARNSMIESVKYDAKNVITESFLQKIGILN